MFLQKVIPTTLPEGVRCQVSGNLVCTLTPNTFFPKNYLTPFRIDFASKNPGDFLGNRKIIIVVIVAHAAIQSFQDILDILDPGLRRGDGFGAFSILSRTIT